MIRRLVVASVVAACSYPALAHAQVQAGASVQAGVTVAAPAPVVVQTAPPPQAVVVASPYAAPPPGAVVYGASPYGYYRAPRWRTRVVPYEGGPIPPGGVLSSRANVALMATGGALLGAGYIAAVLGWFASINCTGWLACSSASAWLFVPLAGPWAALSDPRHSTLGNVLIVADGIVQAAGLTMLIVGAAVRRPVIEYRYVVGRAPRPRAPAGVQWALTPTAGGAAVVGAF